MDGYIKELELQKTEKICLNISIICLVKQSSFVASNFDDTVEI